MIRVEEYTETLLGEIVYIDPDNPELEVTFKTRTDLFADHPEDLDAVRRFMFELTFSASA